MLSTGQRCPFRNCFMIGLSVNGCCVFCSYIAVAGKDSGSVMFVETAKHNNSSDSLNPHPLEAFETHNLYFCRWFVAGRGRPGYHKGVRFQPPISQTPRSPYQDYVARDDHDCD